MRVVATFEYLEQAWDEAAKLIALHPGKLYDVSLGSSGFDVREFLEAQPTPTKEKSTHERKPATKRRSKSSKS